MQLSSYTFRNWREQRANERDRDTPSRSMSLLCAKSRAAKWTIAIAAEWAVNFYWPRDSLGALISKWKLMRVCDMMQLEDSPSGRAVFMHCWVHSCSWECINFSPTQPRCSLIRNIYCLAPIQTLLKQSAWVQRSTFNCNLFQLPIRFALSLALIAYNGSFCLKPLLLMRSPHISLSAQRFTKSKFEHFLLTI